MAVNPVIVVHEVANGGALTGVASDGALAAESGDAGAPYWKGRLRRYLQGTDGGLFGVPDLVGGSIERIMVIAPDATKVQGFVVDEDGFAFKCLDTTKNSVEPSGEKLDPENFTWTPTKKLLIPPNWKFKLVATVGVNGFSADARVVVTFGDGWGMILNGQ